MNDNAKQLSFEEWNNWRAGGITGSEAPIIMNTSPWATPLDLFLRRTGRLAPQKLNFPMRRGLKLEPEAREQYQELAGIGVPARLLESERWSIARASFDGLNEELKHAIEIKCPGREDHLLALSGRIPHKYIFQLVHQLFVSGYQSIDYVSYNPSFPIHHRLARVVFYRDEQLERQLLIEEKKFWECLQTDTPPEQEKSRSSNNFEFPTRKNRAMIPPNHNRR